MISADDDIELIDSHAPIPTPAPSPIPAPAPSPIPAPAPSPIPAPAPAPAVKRKVIVRKKVAVEDPLAISRAALEKICTVSFPESIEIGGVTRTTIQFSKTEGYTLQGISIKTWPDLFDAVYKLGLSKGRSKLQRELRDLIGMTLS